VTLFVDTSVWSLALRRDNSQDGREVQLLHRALSEGIAVFTTGLVLQELLQGFSGAKASGQIVNRFAALPFVIPDRMDHIQAAEIRNTCRRKGIQTGTIDALLAQLCLRHELKLLTTDNDFKYISEVYPLHLI
jgi:predicted nucleic acid-binding protein